MSAELIVRWAGGQIDLMGWNESPYGDYQVETLADGTSWGNPESVRRTLRSALLDGSRSTKVRDSNRTISLSLRLSAPDPSALAGGEAELDKLDGRRCEVVWTPPRNMGIAPSVFVVDFADLMHQMDDLGELTGERFWSLTLDCLPHAYSDEWITVEALPQAVSTRTQFDAGTSLTGWTAAGASLALAGGSVQVTADPGVLEWSVTRTGSVNFSTTRYLTLAGYNLTELASVEVLAGSWVTASRIGADAGAYTFDTGAAATTAIRFTFRRPSAEWGGVPGIDALGRQSTPRSVASKEQRRVIAVPGSRRTPAYVAVQSDVQLGDTIVYSGPNYDPSMAAGVVLGTYRRTANPDNISGGTDSLRLTETGDYTTAYYRRPAGEIPTGTYAIWMKAWALGGVGPVELTARLLDAAGAVISTALLGSTYVSNSSSVIFPVLAAELPGWSLPEGTTAIFELQVKWLGGSDSGGGLDVDQVWMFNLTDGSPAIVKAAVSTRLWLDPETLTKSEPALFVGLGTKSAAVPMSMTSQILAGGGGAMYMNPGETYLYTAFTGAGPVSVSARFRPAGHTHMPELS